MLTAGVLLWCMAGTLFGQPRKILTGAYPPDRLAGILLPRAQWHPFPGASERPLWEGLSPPLKEAYVKRGEEALTYRWPPLSATMYLDYFRTGSREIYSRPSGERRRRLGELVLAECMEGKGRYIQHIVDGIWCICEETSWVPPFHVGEQRVGGGLPDQTDPMVDLVAAETGNLLAWTFYLLGPELDRISPLLRARIAGEVRTRILIPLLDRDDFWWMWKPGIEHPTHHINNWTPWICSNWLAAALILEEQQDRRVKTVDKILIILDRFLDSYPDDGGCDEGPSYWNHAGGSLFECLEVLNTATRGRLDVYSHPLIQEIGRYIQRVHIAGPYYLNYGDAGAKIHVAGDLVARYGVRINDPDLAGFGAAAARDQNIMSSGVEGSLSRQLFFLFNLGILKGQKATSTFERDVWLPQSQVMVAREEGGSARGFTLAALGGHNEQSHNHNDVGSFVLYADGAPVLVDVGVEAYTAKTFSGGRYDIWTMQSAYHNLPTINGQMQKQGREAAARDVRYQAGADSVRLSMDIAGAYPAEAGIRRWDRTLTLDRRSGTVDLVEEYLLEGNAADITFTLMTPRQVIPSGAGRLVLKAGTKNPEDPRVDILVRYDGQLLVPRIESIPLQDRRLRAAWGESLQRILLKVNNPKQTDSLRMHFERLKD